MNTQFAPQQAPIDAAQATQLSSGRLPALLETPEDYSNLAAMTGIGFIEALSEPELLETETECLKLLICDSPVVRSNLQCQNAAQTYILSPSIETVDALAKVRDGSAWLRDRFRIIHHRRLRQALMRRASGLLTQFAAQGLYAAHPEFSAKARLSTGQSILLGVLLLGFAELLVFEPGLLLTILSIAGSILFLSVATLRVAAAAGARPDYTAPALVAPAPEDMPIYTVLVALYDEAEIVPQLLTELGRLQWPRARLEIKLVCEAEDRATIEAIRAHDLREFVEIIEVPNSAPMTKPKALRYALAVSRGEFIVLYDAEDRPHPLQLYEAWARFRTSDNQLACLQAPLEIANRDASWISRMFAFEYAGQFRTTLPWLAACNVVMPLGGTSNHFRRAALDHVGAWDPHNVTEDADLGLRLRRFGYRCGVLELPTFEDAPTSFRIWLNQRTRWSKGWLQTWLVHMRKPRQLFQEAGASSFVVSQVLLLGIVFSCLIHPVFILSIGWTLICLAAGQTPGLMRMAIDLPSVVLGYSGFLLAGMANATWRERQDFWRIFAMTPIYWLMLSLAAWRAVYELWRRPFHWAKTPHKPSSRQFANAEMEIAGE